MDASEFKEAIRRKAIVMEIGGFRPPRDPLASVFGEVHWALPDESWPVCRGAPMLALCQLNLSELPFRPPRLGDLEMMTVFVACNDLPDRDPNGSTWCLRTYESLDGLQPIERPEHASPIRTFPMRPRVVEHDYPGWDDIPIEVPDQLYENYFESHANVPGLKLGGWPTLIQSEIFWAPRNQHPASPEFVFQIDSSDKAGWSWGDGGVGYFGRGTAAGCTNEWALEWQCH